MESNVVSLVNLRKKKALDKNIQELTEVTTIIKTTMQALSKYNHYSSVRYKVNELFVFYNELKSAKNKKLEFLQRLENEQSQNLDG
jgi:hypothetical protein